MGDQLSPNAPLNSSFLHSSPPSPNSFPPELDSWVNFSANEEASYCRTFSDSIFALEPPIATNPKMLYAPTLDHKNVNEDNYKPNIYPPDCHVQPSQSIHHVHSEGDNSSAKDRLQLSIQDPKWVKRILANRRSAQRSREKKLKYISDLQKSVEKLEAEVATLKQNVAFVDCERSILVMHNSHIRHRIAVIAHQNIIKDAYRGSLTREKWRLSQLYQRQNLTKTDAMKEAMAAGGDDTAAIFLSK